MNVFYYLYYVNNWIIYFLFILALQVCINLIMENNSGEINSERENKINEEVLYNELGQFMTLNSQTTKNHWY